MPPSRAMLADPSVAPFVVVWELTQACDLACVHCRASAHPGCSPRELSTAEGESLIGQVKALGVPVFVLSGGDPMKRPDLFHLVAYGARIGQRMALTPSVTPLLTRAALARLKAHGLARLAISLDGATPASHDGFRGVPGAFTRSLDVIAWARELELPLQINTTLSRRNECEFEGMTALMEGIQPVLWSVFFQIPVGRARREDCLDGETMERLFAKLHAVAQRVDFDIKTTEAMHYRRFVMQQRPPASLRAGHRAGAWRATSRTAGDGIGRAPRGLNDGKGFLFVSHEGEVYPSGFLPLSVGNIRRQSLAELYRDAPLLRALRDTHQLEGKCSVCEFREVCGGSRARAFAFTGNPFAADPACSYQPAGWRRGAA